MHENLPAYRKIQTHAFILYIELSLVEIGTNAQFKM